MFLDLDHWREIATGLSANKLRTGLTAFGVAWGILLLVVMLGSGAGLRNGVNAEFSGQASNAFFVWTQRTSKPYRGLRPGRSFEMTNEDVAAVKAGVPQAEIVAPRCQLGGYGGGNNVTRGTKAGAFNVMGDVPEVERIQAMPLIAGRFINPNDIVGQRKVAVIGRRVKQVLFLPGEDPIGKDLRIKGVSFTVVGVCRSVRSGEDGGEDDQTIHVPVTTFQRAFNQGRRIGWLSITSRADVPASIVEKATLALLASRHAVAPDDRRAFGHFNVEEEFGKIQGLFAGIRALVWIVGAGTLAAGVIGVSNIMLVIVRERTREIGIRRTLGATPRAVMGQVVLESVILTSIAGSVGLIVGVAILEGASRLVAAAGDAATMFRNPGVDLSTALQALTLLVVAGTMAGLLPARRAVAISPVDALRG